MINLSAILTSPYLVRPFTVYRQPGHFGEGGWIADTPQVLDKKGVVIPTNSKDIMQLPEGDRTTESFTFYCKDQLYVTNNDQGITADQIGYQGSRYRLFKVKDYLVYGYCKVIGVRMAGD